MRGHTAPERGNLERVCTIEKSFVVRIKFLIPCSFFCSTYLIPVFLLFLTLLTINHEEFVIIFFLLTILLTINYKKIYYFQFFFLFPHLISFLQFPLNFTIIVSLLITLIERMTVELGGDFRDRGWRSDWS